MTTRDPRPGSTERDPGTREQGWEVEWTSEIPTDSIGEMDLDNAVYRYAYFNTQQQARVFARQVIKGLPIEVAYIQQFERISMRQYARTEHESWMTRRNVCFCVFGEREEISE